MHDGFPVRIAYAVGKSPEFFVYLELDLSQFFRQFGRRDRLQKITYDIILYSLLCIGKVIMSAEEHDLS